MSIFIDLQESTLTDLNNLAKNTSASWIGIEFCEIGTNFLIAKMPVDHRTVQPLGTVNGGAYCLLAETVGSVAANLCLNRKEFVAIGLDINANHLKAVREGWVYGKAKPYHIGKSTHVWEIKITDNKGNLCCVSRLTVAIVPIPKNDGKAK